MAHHKRGRPKHQRRGCLQCKPHKDERASAEDVASVQRREPIEGEDVLVQDNPLHDFLVEEARSDATLNVWLVFRAGYDPRGVLESMSRTEGGRKLSVKFDAWLTARSAGPAD